MLNRPTNLFDQISAVSHLPDRPWQVDRQPTVRLVWLFAAMLVPFVAVTGRLIYLQCFLADHFVTTNDLAIVSYEPISTRDGRILASDGRVLAIDVERYSLLMHYRWLQEPADQHWLRQEARSRLSRSDRQNSERVTMEEQKILVMRAAMWSRLAVLTGASRQVLAQRRDCIQERVEHIIASVRRRQRQRELVQNSKRPVVSSPEDARWKSVWNSVVVALTSEPERVFFEPIVVREERDYHTIVQDVPLHVAAEIESNPELYPGLRMNVTTERSYPEGSLASHVIGSRTRIGDDVLRSRSSRFHAQDPLDYQPGDRIGKGGIEQSYDRHLRGLRGLRKVVRNSHHEVIRTESIREPRMGRDVVLTLCIPLQTRAELLLDDVLSDRSNDDQQFLNSQRATVDSVAQGGCIIAIHVHTGAVLAAASAPRFDLDLLKDRETLQRLRNDPRRPFFPRATRTTLPPGSVFKTLTAFAVLESGQIDPDHAIHCRGYLDRPERHRCYNYRKYGVGHGDINLGDALCRSCNVYFFSAARIMGPGPICRWAKRFGFGRPTQIDLPGEPRGNLPWPTSSRWYPGDTLGLAIGQSRLSVTPLQIVRMMAAVANGGYLITPHVARDVGPMIVESGRAADRDEGTVGELEFVTASNLTQRRIPGLSDKMLQRVREGLKKVVAHRTGTGYKHVRMKDIAIAGKTGTAEVGGDKGDHAWFAGFVPADQPRIAFVVVLEHAGSGGKVAGPVARKLVQAMLDVNLLTPTRLSMRD